MQQIHSHTRTFSRHTQPMVDGWQQSPSDVAEQTGHTHKAARLHPCPGSPACSLLLGAHTLNSLCRAHPVRLSIPSLSCALHPPLHRLLDAVDCVLCQPGVDDTGRQAVAARGVVGQLKAEAVDGEVVVLDGALDGQLLACIDRIDR